MMEDVHESVKGSNRSNATQVKRKARKTGAEEIDRKQEQQQRAREQEHGRFWPEASVDGVEDNVD